MRRDETRRDETRRHNTKRDPSLPSSPPPSHTHQKGRARESNPLRLELDVVYLHVQSGDPVGERRGVDEISETRRHRLLGARLVVELSEPHEKRERRYLHVFKVEEAIAVATVVTTTVIAVVAVIVAFNTTTVALVLRSPPRPLHVNVQPEE